MENLFKLTPKQKKFADFYLQSGNATESYIQAGYSGNRESANVNASKLIRNYRVKKYLEDFNKKEEEKNIIKIQEIREFWTSIIRDKDKDMNFRIKASELMAKSFGVFLEGVMKYENKKLTEDKNNPFSFL